MKRNIIILTIVLLLAALISGVLAVRVVHANRGAETLSSDIALLRQENRELTDELLALRQERDALRSSMEQAEAERLDENARLREQLAEQAKASEALQSAWNDKRLAQSVRENHAIIAGVHATQNIPDFEYYLYEPNGDDRAEPHPLVVYLHGIGCSGGELERIHTEEDSVPDFLRDGWLQPNAYVLMPHCPGYSWDEIAGDLMELIQTVAAEKPVDPDRISVTGFSIGGIGCFGLLTRWPDFFSAAAPVASTYTVDSCAVIVRTPVHMYHGIYDQILEYNAPEICDAINNAGGRCELTLYNENHMIQMHYLDNGGAILQWLIEQKRA